MTNNLVLPLLALILAVLAALFSFKREDLPADLGPQRRREIRDGAIISALAVIIFTGATLLWPGTFANGSMIALALAVGAVAGCLSTAFTINQTALPFGFAVIGASVLHSFSAASIGNAQLAFVTGAFISAFATGGIRPRLDGGYLCAFSSLVIVAADFLGRERVGFEAASSSGIALGLALLVSAIVSGLAGRALSKDLMAKCLGFAILLLVGFLACWKFLGNTELGTLWIGGVVVGGVVQLIFAGEEKADSFRFVLATVIWLAGATVAFSTDLRAYGMAVSILGGVSVLVLFGNIRALMTLGVAAAILIYRLFRELRPDEARALDIGQHYTMIGVAIGALLPLLPIEWGRNRVLAGARSSVATALWLVILLGIPVAAAVLLGSKGAIGMVVGFSFAAVVEGIRGAASLAPAGIAIGLGSLTALSYAWLGPWMDLERASKERAVIIVALVVLVFAGALFAVSRQSETLESQ